MKPLLVAACALALVPAAIARVAADPLEGTWSRAGSGAGSVGGTIAIRATGTGTFTGTVSVSYTSSNGCLHPAGKAVWQITGSSGAYTGTNSGFEKDAAQNCPAQLQSTTWRLVSATQLEVCITGFGCATWTRPAPAASRLSLTLLRKRFDVAAAHRTFCNAAAGASTLVCTVESGAPVTICNRDVFHHGPLFSFDRQNRFKSAPVRSGTCFQRRFVNARPQSLTVTIYDEIHSQERLELRVLPQT